MKKVEIKGYICLFDNDDYDEYKDHKFSISFGWGNTPYLNLRHNKKTMIFHRLIMNAPKGLLVDHINHSTLDNRRCNLRLVTRSQNMWNRKRRTGNSKYKGVYFNTGEKKWIAQIYKNDRRVFGDRYENEDDAARAYNAAAKELFGEYAYLNRIGED